MRCSRNEKYLLKFISSANLDASREGGILEVISKLGIKPKFCDYNPVYRIIDELNYSEYLTGKK